MLQEFRDGTICRGWRVEESFWKEMGPKLAPNLDVWIWNSTIFVQLFQKLWKICTKQLKSIACPAFQLIISSQMLKSQMVRMQMIMMMMMKMMMTLMTREI